MIIKKVVLDGDTNPCFHEVRCRNAMSKILYLINEEFKKKFS